MTISRAVRDCVEVDALTHTILNTFFTIAQDNKTKICPVPVCDSVERASEAKIKLLLSCQLFLRNNFFLFYLQHRETNNTSFAKLSAAVVPPASSLFCSYSIHIHLPYSIPYSPTLYVFTLCLCFLWQEHFHIVNVPHIVCLPWLGPLDG